MPSKQTITEATRRWVNFYFRGQFDTIVKRGGTDLKTSSSNGQSFLEGTTFDVGTDDYDWRAGHISLSPEDSGSGFCESFHVTIVGGKDWRGNYFFSVDKDNVIATSSAPTRFAGAHSKNGNQLSARLQQDVIDLMEDILN